MSVLYRESTTRNSCQRQHTGERSGVDTTAVRIPAKLVWRFIIGRCRVEVLIFMFYYFFALFVFTKFSSAKWPLCCSNKRRERQTEETDRQTDKDMLRQKFSHGKTDRPIKHKRTWPQSYIKNTIISTTWRNSFNLLLKYYFIEENSFRDEGSWFQILPAL